MKKTLSGALKAGAIAALLLVASNLRGASEPAALTTIAAIRGLSRDQAAQHVPVRIRVTVTFFVPARWRFYAQDSTGGIYFLPPNEYTFPAPARKSLKVGQIVTLEGYAEPGRYSPIVRVTRVLDIKEGTPPQRREVTLEEMENDGFECQAVQTSGLVSSAFVSSSNSKIHFEDYAFANFALMLRHNGHSLRVLFDHNDGIRPSDLIGADVSIAGIAAIESNGRGQRLESILVAEGSDSIKILRHPSLPVFDRPSTPMERLFAPGEDTGHASSVKVAGTVTFQEIGVRLIVQDGNHAIEAHTQQWATVHPGATVEVLGKPKIEGHAIVLDDAVFREIPGRHTISPLTIQLDKLFRFDWVDPERLLGVLDGTLIDEKRSEKGVDLLLQHGRSLFRAHLHSDRKTNLPPMEIGSLLRVQGVCTIAYSGFSSYPGAIEILLGSASDITILQRPPWWNPRHTLEAFGAFLVCIFGCIVWGLSLRKRVREKTRQLKHQSLHDSLTNLPNRRMLAELIRPALEESVKRKGRTAFLCLDLARIKQINDTLGHDVGDRFLQQTAARFRSVLRDGEILARTGGDEFAVILPLIRDRATAETRAAEFLDALHAPIDVAGTLIHASTSIGISFFPDHGEDGDTLLKHADQAMYTVKSRGEMGYQVYVPVIASERASPMQIEHAIHTGLERGSFQLFYQPQYRMNGTLIGFEALLRLPDRELGWIPPSEFIPIAEKTGLILPLGTWALEQACRQQAEWRDSGLVTVPVAVNVSAPQFRKGDLPDLVRRELARHGLDPSLLELEITESMLIGDSEREVGQIREIRASGVHIAIDDFGTGYSSLSKLHHLPIDRLKIDRAFVQDLGGPRDARVLVKSVIALANAMGMEVLAEGVETELQREMLVLLNCQYIQGYLFSRPVPAEAATKLLAVEVSEELQVQLV